MLNLMNRNNLLYLVLVGFVAATVIGCKAEGNDTGLEYAPQMYHSIPYEPLSQIKDKDAGMWLTSTEESEVGEFYNSNPNNPNDMTMREPAANTVKRNDYNWLPYRIPKDSLEMAAALLENPFDTSEAVLAQGKILYGRFCIHCHGPKGLGGETGKVGAVYLGVTSYASAAVKDKPQGHIFHVITHGKGRMLSHASQISVEDRWRIARYVQTLQQQ